MQTQRWTNEEEGEPLDLRIDGTGAKRHYLEERPLLNGTDVELRLEGRVWMRGTYEWSGLDSRWPGLRVKLDVRTLPENGRPVYAVLAIPPQSLLRWPRR